MDEEYAALIRNSTRQFTTLPPKQSAIGSKWVFRVKQNQDGSINKFKARLVVQGFNQRPVIDFKETFSPVVKPATIRIILTLTLQNNWPIIQLDVNNAFLNGSLQEEKIQKLVDALFSIGYQLPDDDHIQIIFDGLPEEFLGNISSVMSRLSSFTVVEAESFLLAYEDMLDRFKRPETGIPMANLTRSSMFFTNNGRSTFAHRARGGRFGREGRFFSPCPQCQFCGRLGHVVQTCYFRFDQSFQNNSSQNAAQIPFGNSLPPSPSSSFHQPHAYYTAPSSSSVAESSWYPDSGASHHMTNDRKNLMIANNNAQGLDLFVGNGQADNHMYFELWPNHCAVRDQDSRKLLLQGTAEGGIYKLQDLVVPRLCLNKSLVSSFADSNSGSCYNNSCLSTNSVAMSRNKCEPSQNVHKCVSKFVNSPNSEVQNAIDAKSMHKQSFQTSEHSYTSPLELVYGDIWGPSPIASRNGIAHRLACPYTHEQQGSVERKHRHITEMGLSMLATAGLPFQFWEDAFTTVAHLINRLPTLMLQAKSPFEVIFHQQPDYQSLKIFGCGCYPYLRPYNKRKMDYGSELCIFLGYDNQHKGYKCLSKSRKLYLAQHVIFEEKLFPYNEHFREILSSSPNSQPSSTAPSESLIPIPSSFIPILSHPQPIHIENTINNIPVPSYTSDQPPSNSIPISENEVHIPFNNAPTIASHPTNTHQMITRSKNGITKPKNYISTNTTDPYCLKTLPKNAKHAMQFDHWKKAMQTEYNALMRCKTWSLQLPPPNSIVVPCKWVFAIKKNSVGDILRYKARLVAKGFHQHEGIDFEKVYSPVI
ncbi:uncharacterized protein LOC107607655 [Arachis ipaensis]|uniref:uncharacterized protein LOC107607655 n=1 Tax=Arachis ipaensis TaxID=130454 RepID=UPI0007AFA529|nr:uncharacterized protein LOC107607655 [Arachis ipaensis]